MSKSKMDHVAILNKKWGMLNKILSGQKLIESRWYKTSRCPWNQIQIGDNVYFKNSGELVTVKAKVSNVEQISDLSPDIVCEILDRYGKDIGISEHEKKKYFNLFKDKRYCILIQLQAPQMIEPFEIDKQKAGFGPQSAWLVLENINKIRIQNE